MYYAILGTLVPLLFGMSMVFIALLVTYGIHKYVVFVTGQGEDAPTEALLRTARIGVYGGILASVWILAMTAIFNGMDIVGFLSSLLG